MGKRKKGGATEKIMTFRWDDKGGAHIGHNPRLTLTDVKMALSALVCVVAHNDYLNGAMPAVNDTWREIQRAMLEYLEMVALDENLSRVTRLPADP